MRITLILAGVAAVCLQDVLGSEPDRSTTATGTTCEHPAYRVHVVSSQPLVLYIRDFLSESERAHLRAAR